MTFRIFAIVGLALAVVLVLVSRARAGRNRVPACCIVERLTWLAALLGLAVAAITGLIAGIGWGGRMSDLLLMTHCAGAPLFAVAVTAMSLMTSDRYMPDRKSLPGRCSFWLMLASSLVVILTAVIPMTPIFGTHGQELLYETHRYGSLLVMVFALSFAATRGGIAAPAAEQAPHAPVQQA